MLLCDNGFSVTSRAVPASSSNVHALEQQAHGHTADLERPLRTELMADDTIELLRQIGVRQADFFGYSLGAAVALDIGLRHPDRVRKLVLAAVTYNKAGNQPGVVEGIEHLRPEQLLGTQWHNEYLRIAPRPQDFPRLVERVKDWFRHLVDHAPTAIRLMRAPTLLVIGDSDVVRPEHTVETFRLLGGGVLGGQTNSELAFLPATRHDTLVDRADLLLPIVPAFLNRPMPATEGK